VTIKSSTILLVLIFIQLTYGQDRAQGDISVNATLVKGIQLNRASGNLDFGEIVLSPSTTSVRKSPENGVVFVLNSHPNKSISISFSTATLSNSGWANENGGTNSSIIFTPEIVQTGINSNFVDPITLLSGTSVIPPTSSGIALMNIWIGGTLDIQPNQPQGDYTGTLVISLTY